MRHLFLLLFLPLVLLACSSSSPSTQTDADADADSDPTLSETLSEIDSRFNELAANNLNAVGDSETFTSGIFLAKIQRFSNGTDFSFSHESTRGTSTITGAATLLDNAPATIDLRVLIADEDPFGEGEDAHLSPILRFLVSTTSGTAFTNLSTQLESISVDLPCDTTSCEGICFCECYGREADGTEWSKTGVVTYYDEDDPDTIECRYKNTDLFITSRVQNACLPGFTSDDGSAPCNACAAGRFQEDAAETECITCNVGTYSPTTGSPECLLCPTGQFQAFTGSTDCSLCPVGFYQDEIGQTECTACVAGQFQDEQGKASCDECAAGRYQDQPGQISCILCPVGRFQAETGSTDCDLCPAGQYQDGVGSSSCTACPAGEFQPAAEATTCLECAAGTFQSQTGQTACVPCPAGRSQNQAAQAACVPCEVGKFQDETGQETCDSCPAGTYQNATEATACLNCPAGSFQADQGAAACDLCPEDTFSANVGADSCVACPGGTGSNPGSAACSTLVTIDSVTAPAAGVYGAGQNVSWTLNFSEAVTVTGTPRIDLDVGDDERFAEYVSGSGTAALVFTWEHSVSFPSIDEDGIEFDSADIDLNGGTIEAVADDRHMELEIPTTTFENVLSHVAPLLAWYDASAAATVLDAEDDSPGDGGFSTTMAKWVSRVDSPTMDATVEAGTILYDATGLNNRPSIDLPGNGYLEAEASVLSDRSAYSLFSVAFHDAADGNRQLFAERRAGSDDEVLFGNSEGGFSVGANGQSTTVADAIVDAVAPYLLYAFIDPTELFVGVSGGDSSRVDAATNTLSNMNNLRIGRQYSGGQYWDGDVSEILIFDTAINSVQFTAAEAHLSEKWGMD